MNKYCRRRSTCRLCGGGRLTAVLSLEPTPPANAFVTLSEAATEQERFPLDVFFCEDCAHVQLLDVVDPRVLFENYVYVSGTSPVFVKHFEDYAEQVLKRFQAAGGGLVVDIGSNDGTLLGVFQRAGWRVLGVDPARQIARAATQSGIETIDEFFTPDLGRAIRDDRGPADIVTANNVFAHIDDLAGVAEGIRELLADDGIFVFEVSYLADVFEKTLFDTIYHEHLAYHSVKPLRGFFARHGMEMIEALRVDSHGGSLRGFVQRKGGHRRIGASVTEMAAREERLGLDRAETFHAFAARVEALKIEFSGLLRRLKTEGRSIAGYGAPAKATTLMYHFGIDRELIDFIVDDSPLKQGLLTPGLHIPVLATGAISERGPDVLVILAWNFAASIIARHAAFRDAGGRFLTPLPEVEMV
ncbi:MAG: class I SAM-dependent methyltransferase [Rhodospirillales bacterium]|jgi:SAM-dependent methyltransferase|nr:class I SAM-dependent methyltransferase [Rhodospirillales bacterium]HIJ43646.1 class I SAM-dependent methyltransferase [Rhodospirillaceae bacterium]MDP7097781.1 class I SAM-dependent methyltransferase [Rhodospirillales bacterium]MDP7215433.1 class I SAM-dependent methyltransferase [Rhodospirillales bacterium]HIJ46356.1 class I SAM-dependent methyltransferase [Rhodospirillaceae bacterium]